LLQQPFPIDLLSCSRQQSSSTVPLFSICPLHPTIHAHKRPLHLNTFRPCYTAVLISFTSHFSRSYTSAYPHIFKSRSLLENPECRSLPTTPSFLQDLDCMNLSKFSAKVCKHVLLTRYPPRASHL